MKTQKFKINTRKRDNNSHKADRAVCEENRLAGRNHYNSRDLLLQEK